MAWIPDNIKLVHMNLLDMHDTATSISCCNLFSRHKTGRTPSIYCSVTIPLVGLVTSLRRCSRIFPANIIRQERSFCEMLNVGIRVFDMRYAYNIGNDAVSSYDWMYASTALRASGTNKSSSPNPPCSDNPVEGHTATVCNEFSLMYDT